MDTPEYKCYCKPLSEMGWTITEQLGEGGQAVVYRCATHKCWNVHGCQSGQASCGALQAGVSACAWRPGSHASSS